MNQVRLEHSINFIVRSTVVNAGPEIESCSKDVPVELTNSEGNIRSPGYMDREYANNVQCQWLIKAPADKVRMS